MKYAGVLYNDFSAAPGVSVSFFTQGCIFRCAGCHNPETWEFDGGEDFTADILDNIIEKLTDNSIKRNFCLMGGEPLCPENLFLSYLVLSTVKEKSPDTPIYIWTGYKYEDLIKRHEQKLDAILEMADVLIDGPFIEAKRDVTLKMRGSTNQRIIYLKEGNDMLKIIRNPDEAYAKRISDALEKTGGQCPCIPKYAWTEDTKCMCKAFREQSEPGPCHCGLYEKIDFNK